MLTSAWSIRIDRTAAVSGARVRTPAVDRFVQFADVGKFAAKAASTTTSLAHRVSPVSGSRPAPCRVLSEDDFAPDDRFEASYAAGRKQVQHFHVIISTRT